MWSWQKTESRQSLGAPTSSRCSFGRQRLIRRPLDRARRWDFLCPVKAMDYRIVCPDRFQGMDAERPLFVWGNGSMLRRTEVQFLLQKAAKAEGLPSERFLSHSLRIGGASALYQVFGNIELVKRMGRWSSSTVQRYLFDGGDVVKQLSVKMADLDRRIHYTWVCLCVRHEKAKLGGKAWGGCAAEGPYATLVCSTVHVAATWKKSWARVNAEHRMCT